MNKQRKAYCLVASVKDGQSSFPYGVVYDGLTTCVRVDETEGKPFVVG